MPEPLDYRKALVARHLIELYRQANPSDDYDPHREGQIQFHQSKHKIRALFPGNGFGKTRCITEEAHAWCMHTNRWQVTPSWPVVVVWFCPQYSQFDILREQIEGETIGSNAKLVSGSKGGMFYRYPNGSRWFIASADRSWTFMQGINPDLVLFDEEPPPKLWREMMMRSRGKRKTRYAVAATATKGLSFLEAAVYQPWLDHHTAMGLSLETAVENQLHPRIWCQPFGSAADNPGNSADDWKWYQEQSWTSEKEKEVRLHGGFADFTGDGVFDPASMQRLREEIAAWRNQYPDWPIEGMLEPVFPDHWRPTA